MSENKDNNDNKEIKEVTSKTLVDFKIPEDLLNEQNQKKKKKKKKHKHSNENNISEVKEKEIKEEKKIKEEKENQENNIIQQEIKKKKHKEQKIITEVKEEKNEYSKEKEETEIPTVIEKKDFTKIKYESFEKKITKKILLLIFTLILSIGTIYYALNNTEKETVSYSQYGNVDYKVCLKNNNFYTQNCLDKNMSYVSTLIKNVAITFDYDLSTNKDLDIKTEYEVDAKLVISNTDNTSKYYEQKYILKPKTSEGIVKINNAYKISQNVDIDYDYYNAIASNFKSQYRVETNSYLEVSFQVYHTNSTTGDVKVTSPSPVVLNIPLSQKSININMASSGINKQETQNIESSIFTLKNIICLFIGVISLIVCLISSLKVAKMLSLTKEKKNNYDKFIEKILREYDRLIVETSTLPKFNEYYVTKVNSFGELIDVRDNLRLPIMYYEVAKHQKCHLYITNNKNLYLLTIKAVDMEGNK